MAIVCLVRAYAGACVTDQIGRPIAGHINIAPSSLESNIDINLATVKHEMIHVLGFSANSYRTFVNAEDEQLEQRLVERGPRMLPYGKRVYELVTPRLVSKARQHFACTSLDGVEMEDADPGGQTSPGDHFEKRIFGPGKCWRHRFDV